MIAPASEKYALSRYNHYMRARDDQVLVFNAVSRVTVVLEPEEWRRLKIVHRTGAADPDEDWMLQLRRARMLVPSELDELAIFQTMHRQARFGDHSLTLTIAPTLSCNFGCDYCYQTHNKPLGRMSEEVQDAFIEWIKGYAPSVKNVGVAWYGGEPTMAWGVIKSLTERMLEICEEHKLGYSAMMVSNGFALDEAKAKDLDSLKITNVQITFDGPKDVHDGRRHLLNKKPTFDRILQNIQRAVEVSKTSFNIRVNIDSRNRDRIEELIATLGESRVNLDNRCSTYYAPVEGLTEETVGVEGHLMQRKEYARLETRLYDAAQKGKVSGIPYPGGWNPGNCGAVKKNGWVVVPNGDLHKCWDEVNYAGRRVGSLLEMNKSDPPNGNLQRWMSWEFKGPCLGCSVLPLCVGGCPLKTVRRMDVAEINRVPCLSYRFEVRERLRRYAASKGEMRGPSEYRADVPISEAECGIG